MSTTTNLWRGKRVLVTGAAGTVGGEILRQLAGLGPAEIIGLDNNETEIFFAQQEGKLGSTVHLYVADIRDPLQLRRHMEGIDIVLHAAAYKHVFLCEQSPANAVQTNILGTQNVIDAAIAANVERVLLTSSDKAVNPTSVMGTSKLMGERLMVAANSQRRGGRPLFAATRFGNVLGSRGSVVPVFLRQIAQGGPVTLTHAGMTRFVMTLAEAVNLVTDSVFMATGGEVFVTKMPVVRIPDLAAAMIGIAAPQFGYQPEEIAVKEVGVIAGEKLYEELLNDEETRRTVELERHFVVLPALRPTHNSLDCSYPGLISRTVARSYTSANEAPLSVGEIKSYLVDRGVVKFERHPFAATASAGK